MQRRDFLKLSSSAGIITLVTPSGILQAFTPGVRLSTLDSSFINPPPSARPYNLWFWMNGQVSKQGITLDLEAMHKAGIGGVFNFDAGTGIPKGAIEYLSPEWLEMKKHAFNEAERLNIAFTMHNCPGWSSSGGPWITPELSMQVVTWSELYISGGKQTTVNLPRPDCKKDYYRDVAVIAYPTLAGERSINGITSGSGKKFNDWKKRANFEFTGTGLIDIDDSDTSIIKKEDVLDLTGKLSSDGVLEWNAPAGDWTILRIGHTTTGELNKSAPDSGIGLECDKYSLKAIDFHFNKMMEILLPAIGPMVKSGKMGLEIDSFEVGMQNWTPGFETEFEKRNNYQLTSYLPTLTGRLVESADATERFLWDFRRTQGDLIADNYYGRFDELCNKSGIISFIQPYDRGPMEEMQIGSRVDANMGEFWNGLSAIFQNNLTMRRTPKLGASIAHVNGQMIVPAESFTSEPGSAKWQEYPFHMKATGDKGFTHGVNRMLIHRFAHQPHPTALPGMTMGAWGIHFDRTTTWWDQGREWLAYLWRSQSLFQQGLFVADLLYFTGEDAGVYTNVERETLNPVPPSGYDYDLINAETLYKRISIKENKVLLPDGLNYKVFVLQQYKTMTLELLLKLIELVNQGMLMVGARPERTPGLRDRTKTDARFKVACDQLWGERNSSGVTDKKVGNGRVIWGRSIQGVLASIQLQPDFECSSLSGDAPVIYTHRIIGNADVYFIANQRRKMEEVVCTLRIKGKRPELWNPQTGEITVLHVYEVLEAAVRVPLTLDPYGSTFLVFRSVDSGKSILSVDRDNLRVFGSSLFPAVTRKLYREVTDNFLISFWVKPELDIMITTKNYMEHVKDPWTDHHAIYPSCGHDLYGKDQSTAGLAVGRNGLAVWEHGSGKPVMVLSAPVAIEGWSHIALLYRNAIPAVYVNGKLSAQGTHPGRNVHPGIGHVYLSEGGQYYNGDMTDPQLFTDDITESKIRSLASLMPEVSTEWKKVVSVNGNSKADLLFWENGLYSLKAVQKSTAVVRVVEIKPPAQITGAWDVYFPAGMGAPDHVSIELGSLHKHSIPGVKYFSGTATYKKKFTHDIIPAGGKRLFLDLGRVEVIAGVILNGKSLGILWSRPYLVDITEALIAGENNLEIIVTNLWPNRLIGDEQVPDTDAYIPVTDSSSLSALSQGAIITLPAWYLKGEPKPDNGRITFTTWKHHTKSSPLLESGLIGPVILREAMGKKIT